MIVPNQVGPVQTIHSLNSLKRMPAISGLRFCQERLTQVSVKWDSSLRQDEIENHSHNNPSKASTAQP
jgi:hypothetical protein